MKFLIKTLASAMVSTDLRLNTQNSSRGNPFAKYLTKSLKQLALKRLERNLRQRLWYFRSAWGLSTSESAIIGKYWMMQISTISQWFLIKCSAWPSCKARSLSTSIRGILSLSSTFIANSTSSSMASWGKFLTQSWSKWLFNQSRSFSVESSSVSARVKISDLMAPRVSLSLKMVAFYLGSNNLKLRVPC